jgi:hypothetical protein
VKLVGTQNNAKSAKNREGYEDLLLGKEENSKKLFLVQVICKKNRKDAKAQRNWSYAYL